MLRTPTVDSSSQKLYHDDTELLADSSITKPLGKEVEAVVESPVRKISIEELEASADVACKKMAKDKVLDTTLESPSLKMCKDESLIEATSRKIPRDRVEVPMDVTVRKGLSSELDTEFPSRKTERDSKGDLMDTGSRNIYRERGEVPLDVRKILWNELETSTDASKEDLKKAPRKISRGMMGASVDSASRMIMRDDPEHLFDSVSRRVTRESMGMSLDTGSRKLPWSKGECQLDSSVRALAKDKIVETIRAPPRRISREEIEYSTDSASLKMIPREKFDALLDISPSTEKQEFCLEPSTNRKILRDELETSAGSLRRRIPRMPREDTDISTNNPIGKIWDRADVPMEIHKQLTMREELGATETSSSPGRIGQPDLMATSQVHWRSSSDLFTVGPLSQLVYDGILEKSTGTAATSLSASAPNLPHSRLLSEMEKPVPPPRAAPPSPASPLEAGDERTKDKEKSKKSMKLKNLFKKKNESTAEKHQSGLQKL